MGQAALKLDGVREYKRGWDKTEYGFNSGPSYAETGLCEKVQRGLGSQSTQSAVPVRFSISCSIGILLATLVVGLRPQCTAGAD